MKKLNLILLIILITYSCNNEREKELNNQIEQLELENAQLKYSIEKNEINRLIGSKMVPLLDKNQYNLDDKGKVTFWTHDISNFYKEYSVYEMLNNGEKGKVLLKNLTASKFEYPFDLKQMNGNQINLLMEFVFKDEIIQIPAKVKINIKE